MAELTFDLSCCIVSGGVELRERVERAQADYSGLCKEYFENILAKYGKSGKAFPQSACAFLLLDELLKKQGVDRQRLAISRNAEGRPCVINRSDVDFSISHSEGAALACVAVGKDAEIGADIQRVRNYTNEHMEQLARSFMDEAELTGFLSSTERTEYFYTAWTRREALFKRTGSYHGLNGSPERASAQGRFITGLVTACGSRYYYSISLPDEADQGE